jgi:RNA polymerase sigma factor (sigma-70 family)
MDLTGPTSAALSLRASEPAPASTPAATPNKRPVEGLVFDTFYAEARPRLVRALALTLGDVELATDAIDEALARAVARWPKIEHLDNPAGWVYRVALNWSTSVLRRRRRRRELYARIERNDDQPPRRFESDVALAQAVSDLPIDLRAVVVCRFFLDLDVNSTALALGVRPGTVKSRLSRALAALRLAFLAKELP